MSVNKAIVVGNLGRDPEVRALPSGQSVASFSALGTMLIVKLWFLPLLIFAEAAYFLIELPEHLGCDKTTRNVLQNTRTIVGSRFSRWLTNCNNLHVEHHIFPTLAMKYLVKVHERPHPIVTI